jgi:uncharacterized membrane protein YjfL (UPF0719 family)
MGRVSESVSFGVDAVIGIFIFFIIFTAFLPTLIEYINNNSTSVGLPQVTILIVSLFGLIFVAGMLLKMWDKMTGKEPPQGYPQMGGY